MRHFLLAAVLSLGCGESSATPAAPGGAGGPIDVTGIESSGGSAGGGGASGAGGAGGEPAGACNNLSDLEALAIAGSVRDVARDCGTEGFLPRCNAANLSGNAYEACINSCVETDVEGLSSECAGCYGAMERCSIDSFCLARCQLDTCSELCLSCVRNAGCIEEFEFCRGLAGAECAG